MKSRSRNRSRWAHANSPDGLRHRQAVADAKREAIASALPAAYSPPAPLSPWQTVLVLDADGKEMHRVSLYVPTDGHRCDQHAADIDGERALLSATEIGRRVAAMIRKRPSVYLQAEIRRDEWRSACAGA